MLYSKEGELALSALFRKGLDWRFQRYPGKRVNWRYQRYSAEKLVQRYQRYRRRRLDSRYHHAVWHEDWMVAITALSTQRLDSHYRRAV